MEQINLNIIPDGVMPVCHASQFDKNRTIRFNLKDNGSVYTLAGTETITCKVRKPDDTENTINVANTSSSYVDVTFGLGDTDLSGYAMCELKIVKGTQTIGSRNFLLNIEADAFDGSKFEERSASGAIASFETNYIDNLNELIVDINAVQDLHGYSHPWIGGAGKNKAQVTATSQTINDITYTVNTDGIIKANGTATSASILDCGQITLNAGNSYILSGCPTGGSGLTYCLFLRGSGSFAQKLDFGTGISFTVDETVTTTLSIIVYNGVATNNLEFKPMIRLSGTSSDFEPYENICPISGWSSCDVVRCGKNFVFNSLGNINTPTNFLYPQGDGLSIAVNNNTRTLYARVAKNTDYVISFASNPQRNIAYGLDAYPDVGVICHALTVTSLTSTSFKLNSGEYEYIAFYYCNDIANIPQDAMCEVGSTATTYEPYNGTTYPISLGDTYYGGPLNVTTGELTVTSGYIASYNGEAINEPWISSIDEYVPNTSPSTGAEVVYTLTTHTTVQLTPTEVRTLLNCNIFADTGDVVSCKYLVEVT